MAITSEYVNHVSFDDLAPSFVADNQPLLTRHKAGHEVDFKNPFLQVSDLTGIDRAARSSLSNLDISGSFKTLSRGSSTYAHESALRSPRSPNSSTKSGSNTPSRDSPQAERRSILRKREFKAHEDIKDFDLTEVDSQQEYQINTVTDKNTQENSGCSHGYTTSAFTNLNEVEDKIMRQGHNGQKAAPKSHRKSFAGMSDAELADLEKKYEAASRTNYDVKQFDFGEQEQLYIEPDNSRPIGPGNQWPQTIYPSRPCVNHKALTITKEHRDFSSYVQEHRHTEDKECLRTMVCAISGRRHTWSAVDWYVKNLAQDGDHLVIVTRVPKFEELAKQTTSSRTSLLDGYDFKNDKIKSPPVSRRPSTSDCELAGLEIDALARSKCQKMLLYYLGKLSGKVMKVTVELIKDNSTTYALTSAIALYRPDFKVVSTVSTNLHIKFKNGHVKLPNFLMRHFWVPTYVIPYEFIDPALLGEKVEETRRNVSFQPNMTDDQVTRNIDKILSRTFTNPYGPKDGPKKSETDTETGSVDSYFPLDPETKRKLEEFERVGYLRPVPTRRDCDLSKQTSFASSKSSRRSSRVQFSGSDNNGMYKVKSLIDYDDKDGGSAKKTKSIASTHSNGKPSSARKPPSTRRTKSMDTVPATENKKKGGKLGDFFRKIGLGK
ncbi:LAME_0E01288g1_1 [Lachancea meyersii CBS 8951]|uniref:LAME_0E01288g1_1 n=1 Tax=Lachancea meyersii CBS 8951 TaxID=1266667 RepID=A0A1G4JFB6_9SACH|nr:LAME_0E01288g1_1 [Lachancea meyersii CBS 8951]